jgi:hypothetical protein
MNTFLLLIIVIIALTRLVLTIKPLREPQFFFPKRSELQKCESALRTVKHHIHSLRTLRETELYLAMRERERDLTNDYQELLKEEYLK